MFHSSNHYNNKHKTNDLMPYQRCSQVRYNHHIIPAGSSISKTVLFELLLGFHPPKLCIDTIVPKAALWGVFCQHFQTSEIHPGCPTSQSGPPQPPDLFPPYEGAVREKNMFSPHQALPNSWQRITLEKLILKQLWRRFVNLRGAGWHHPLPSVVFWLKTANRQLDGPWSCT